MTPMTVDSLYQALRVERIKGNGNKVIMVSDDDECNGYHCLWGFTPEDGEPMYYLGDDEKHHTAKTLLIS